jgi:Tfp pilus assembly protein PilN
MIRANVLPRPKESISLFGIRVDSEYAREALGALGLSILIASIGLSLEAMRIAHLEADVAEQERAIVSRSIERAAAKELALETARYELIDRDARLYRTSGNAIAAQIARIGNRIPSGVWLDTIEHTNSGYTVSGDARSIAGIGDTIDGFSRVPEVLHADLVSIDGSHSSTESALFTANVVVSPGVSP